MVVYEKNDIDEITFELKNGKSLICQTDTINGILSKYKQAIFKFKKRSITKKIVLFIPNLSYVKNPNLDFIKLGNKFWPGALTLVYNGISYRIPNDEFILQLLERTGPLYCSSANISGQKTPINTLDAYEKFIQKKKLIVIDGNSFNKNASTIYNVNSKLILRQGDIELKDIQLCLK